MVTATFKLPRHVTWNRCRIKQENIHPAASTSRTETSAHNKGRAILSPHCSKKKSSPIRRHLPFPVHSLCPWTVRTRVNYQTVMEPQERGVAGETPQDFEALKMWFYSEGDTREVGWSPWWSVATAETQTSRTLVSGRIEGLCGLLTLNSMMVTLGFIPHTFFKASGFYPSPPTRIPRCPVLCIRYSQFSAYK